MGAGRLGQGQLSLCAVAGLDLHGSLFVALLIVRGVCAVEFRGHLRRAGEMHPHTAGAGQTRVGWLRWKGWSGARCQGVEGSTTSSFSLARSSAAASVLAYSPGCHNIATQLDSSRSFKELKSDSPLCSAQR